MTGKVGIAGGILRAWKGEATVDRAKELAARLGIEVLMMDADMVFGRVHVETAVEHADRAFQRRKNVAGTKMMEVMLYASGERQLSTAIKKMGVKKGTRRVALLVSDPKRLHDAIDNLGLKRDDSVLEGRIKNLSRFGIPRKALESVGKDRVLELVLERVAMVDLLK